jgi:hypothetical protein
VCEANFCSQVTSECSNPNGAVEEQAKKKKERSQLPRFRPPMRCKKTKKEPRTAYIYTVSPLQGKLGGVGRRLTRGEKAHKAAKTEDITKAERFRRQTQALQGPSCLGKRY